MASQGNTSALEGAVLDAEAQLEKEELDVERAISGITEVQVCINIPLVVFGIFASVIH